MIVGIDHVGLAVADMDRSNAFYSDVLGLRVVVDRPFSGPDYEAVLGIAGVEGRVVLLERNGLRLELFEFTHPQSAVRSNEPSVSTLGITHFCVDVVDIESEYERMRLAGVRFHCPPRNFSGRAKATYARDPDGNVFELREQLTPAPRG